ncbi:hypothetical protein NDU88_008651 [Pleurodeles waltl]|uniref:Uncharacterized protein n=1 Tax=Pleurodeles waltl TaxID=8319 RepID=A0AAV7N5L4_PLEWA|nr:hypothetical protein NDU88_008651 [Pleurodeles waltl]
MATDRPSPPPPHLDGLSQDKDPRGCVTPPPPPGLGCAADCRRGADITRQGTLKGGTVAGSLPAVGESPVHPRSLPCRAPSSSEAAAYSGGALRMRCGARRSRAARWDSAAKEKRDSPGRLETIGWQSGSKQGGHLGTECRSLRQAASHNNRGGSFLR